MIETKIYYSEDSDCFVGEVIDTDFKDDIVKFFFKNLREYKKELKITIRDYSAFNKIRKSLIKVE